MRTIQEVPLARDLTDLRLQMFSMMWAAATLFHLAGNPRPAFVAEGTARFVVAVALGVVAVSVLFAPGSRRRRVALCALIPVSAWLEAPIVGNHWVLATAVSCALLVAEGLAGRRGGSNTWRLFAPSARCVLLVAYGFAAFAKLNSDFFDPAVSCAVFYQDQLVSSWGLDLLSVDGSAGLGRVIAVGAVLTELAVPLLLLLRRTRRLGLLVGVSFHGMLALDLSQHFWDFTSVLFACFFLFLDDEQVAALRRQAKGFTGSVRPATARLLATFGLLLALLASGAGASTNEAPWASLGVLAGHLAWLTLGVTTMVAVGLATLQTSPAPDRYVARLPHLALALVPAMVLFNGLTPYLEIKTGFGWNMYSNLRTVDGQTNHLILGRTLPLTDLQSDTVEILTTDDPELEVMVDAQYVLVAAEFEEYLDTHPGVTLTYRQDGRVREHRGGADSTGTSEVSRRLQAFRPIDVSRSERCVPVFTPAR